MIPYIINAGLILAGCLAFYKLLLQKETFYRLNRYMLVVCIVVAFSLPLLPVPQQWSLRKADAVAVQTIQSQENQQQGNTLNTATQNNSQSSTQLNNTPGNNGTPSLDNSKALNNTKTSPNTVSPTPTTTSQPFTFRKALTWLMYLYWFGVAVFALNFLAQIIVLLYRAYTRPVIADGKFRIVEVSGNKAPCSFANNIFINPEKYDWDTYNQILLHEKVHIMQGHSWDILLAEIVLIFQWFNPFAWIYRKEIENNLEFLTDDDLVQHKGVEMSTYQLSLLKVSAPHFPLSLTTNYNQSLLKKRIAMMNAKKSSVHTAWKYLFLLPLLVMFACILNEPVAYGQNRREKTMRDDKNKDNENDIRNHNNDDLSTEGVWFATIRNDKIHIRFKQEDDGDRDSYNGSSFKLSEFSDLPRNGSGSFSLTRDAGTMRFTGRFEGNEGMGRYQFVPNRQYTTDMEDEGLGRLNDRDVMVFFFIDVTRSYVRMLKDQGFRNFDKDDVIPMAALNVNEDFIRSIRNSGYKDVQMQTLVSLKALGVDGDYIREIRDAGYKNISLDQLISFKAQGIDKDYLTKLEKANLRLKDGDSRNNRNNNRNNNNDDEDDDERDSDARISADNVVALKALDVTEEYINSFKEVGYSNISNSNIISMKAMGITPAYVKSIQDMGYSKLPVSDIVAFKAQNITSDYVRSFESVGYENIPPSDIVSMKAMGITPAYIKTIQSMGYGRISLSDIVAFKAQNITSEYIRSFESVGYESIPISEIIAFKATGVTPEFIKSFESVGFTDIPLSQVTALKAMHITPSYIQNMRDKGFNYKKIDKYIQLKAVTE